jgi:hypothetical protein
MAVTSGEDINLAAHASARGVGQSGFADSGLAQQARIHGQVLIVYHHPCGQQMPHQLFLPDPLDRQLVGMGEVQGDAFDLNRHRLALL